MNFEELLKFAADQGASDVHLQSGSAPQVRIDGLIRNVESPAIDVTALRQFAASIAPKAIADDMAGALVRGARFSRSFDGLGRFRCSLYGQRGNAGLVMHAVPATIATIDQLNLPAVLREVAQTRRGITIVTGPSGSGKSSTLAAIVDHLNETLYGKIVTIEDPIEALHSRKKGAHRPARDRHRRRIDGRRHRAGGRAGRRRDRRRRSPPCRHGAARPSAPRRPAIRSSRPCSTPMRPRLWNV